LDEVGADTNAAAPVGAWVANLRNVRFWVCTYCMHLLILVPPTGCTTTLPQVLVGIWTGITDFDCPDFVCPDFDCPDFDRCP